MAYKPSARSHHQETDQELNLIPMMNLICMLIPFLLLTAAFVKVAVVDVSSPRFVDGPAPGQAREYEPPHFTLTITDQGYQIFVNGEKLTSREVGPTLPRLNGGQYNHDGLRFLAQEIKNRDRTKTSVILSAEPDVPYEELIEVMDAVREDADGEPLFPEVVVANQI